ncbi:MAG: hypothetical protein IJ874_00095 [Ruminococcus sp.]|nr:hypothetical protein [Ruminococcus sp.]
MNREKLTRRRGSVLLTVVSVMALLIIFLSATLILANASNKRAHRSYSSSQAEYTARTAIESFTTAMQRNPDIAGAVQNLSGTIYPRVVLGDTSLGHIGTYDASGRFQDNGLITVEPVTTDAWAYGDNDNDGTNEWYQVDTVKITALVRVGKEVQSVSAYINKLPANASQGSSGAIRGLQTAGGAATTTTGGSYSGALALGLTTGGGDTYSITNSAGASGYGIRTDSTFVNGNLTTAGQLDFLMNYAQSSRQVMDYTQSPPVQSTVMIPSGIVITGNMLAANPLTIDVEYSSAAFSGNYTEKDVPYMFVNGAFVSTSTADSLVKNGNGNPFNMFLGTMYVENGMNAYADIYMMDKYEPTETYTLSDGTTLTRGDNQLSRQGASRLYEWTNSVATQAGDYGFTTFGGNIFCNGNLSITNKTEVDKDVYVAGDLIIKNPSIYNLAVTGKLVVGGKIVLDGGSNKVPTAGGGIYCDNVVVSGAGNAGKRVDTIVHPASYITGLIEVNNVQREYYAYTPTADRRIQYDWGAGEYLDLYGNPYDWSPATVYYPWREDYDGHFIEPTDFDEALNWVEPGAGFSRQYQLPNQSTTYTAEVEVVDLGGGTYTFKETSRRTDLATRWYDLNTGIYYDTPTPVDTGEYRTIADYDGNDTGIVTTDEYVYWSEADHSQRMSEYEATHAFTAYNGMTKHPLSDLGLTAATVYPSTMTREAIWFDKNTNTEAPAATKIVKTLKEAQSDIGYTHGTGFGTQYYTSLPANDDGSARTETTLGNVSNQAIDLASDGAVVINRVDGDVTLKPTGECWVVLDNTTISGGSNLIVDSAHGSVNFLIKGQLYMEGNGSGATISNKTIFDRLQSGTKEVHENDPLGIAFYSEAAGASIKYYNNATIMGTANCPYLDILGDTVGGRWSGVSYYDKSGNLIFSNMGVHWIGGALVKSVSSGFNNFGLAFVESGGAGGGNNGVFNTQLGYFQYSYLGAN